MDRVRSSSRRKISPCRTHTTTLMTQSLASQPSSYTIYTILCYSLVSFPFQSDARPYGRARNFFAGPSSSNPGRFFSFIFWRVAGQQQPFQNGLLHHHEKMLPKNKIKRNFLFICISRLYSSCGTWNRFLI